MNGWQEWLKLLIALVIIIGFFDMLLPANDIKKLVKLVAGLVLMLAVLQPILAVVNLNWSNSADYFTALTSQEESSKDWERNAVRLSEAGLRPVLRIVEENAVTQLENLITENNWVKDADINIRLTGDGEIRLVSVKVETIEEVSLVEQKKERVAKLTSTVADYLQIPETLIQITLKYHQEEMDYVR